MSQSLLELGLDVTQVQKSLDDLTKRFEKSMDKNAKATDRLSNSANRVGGAFRRMGGMIRGGLAAAGIAVGVAGLKQMANIALSVGKNMQAAREKFAPGSERFNAATGGGAKHEGESVVAAAKVEDFLNRAKIEGGDILIGIAKEAEAFAAGINGAADALAKRMPLIKPPEWLNSQNLKKAALALSPGALLMKKGKEIFDETDAGKAANKAFAEKEEAARKAQEARKAKGLASQANLEDELATRDRIARSERTGLVTNEEKRYLLLKQLDLAKAQQKIADDPITHTREGKRAADAALGNAAAALEAFDNEREKEAHAAKEQTVQMELRAKGMVHIAELTKKVLAFEDQITKARRDGNKELEKTLTKQKNIAKIQALAEAHAVTPEEKREARKAARVMKADAAKQQARFDEVERQEKGRAPIDFKKVLARKGDGFIGPAIPVGGVMGALGSVAAKRDTGRRGQEAAAFKEAMTNAEHTLKNIEANTEQLFQNVR